MARNKIKKKRKIDELWLLLIVMFFIIFVSVLTQKNELQEEAETILDELMDDKEHSFAQNNIIHEGKLEKVSGMSYRELKNSLNVKNDFCVYFEDENGNLVEVKDGIRSIGSDVIKVNGVPCGG
jgi:hypothetical protein